MRKKILAGVVCLTMVASMLGGCGDKKTEPKSTDEKVTSEGQASSDAASVSNADIMSAYKDYYDEFCKEHYKDDVLALYQNNDNYSDIYYTASYVDCIGRVIYFENQPMLVLADWVPSDPDYMKYNISILEYKDNQVVEKYQISDFYAWDDGVQMYVEADMLLFKSGTDYYSEDTMDGRDWNKVVYGIRDGEVFSYLYVGKDKDRKDNNTGWYLITRNGKSNECVEIDNKIEECFKNLNKEWDNPTYYLFSDDFELEPYGALVGDDFKRYLDEVASLDVISSESELEEIYNRHMEYDKVNPLENID